MTKDDDACARKLYEEEHGASPSNVASGHYPFSEVGDIGSEFEIPNFPFPGDFLQERLQLPPHHREQERSTLKSRILDPNMDGNDSADEDQLAAVIRYCTVLAASNSPQPSCIAFLLYTCLTAHHCVHLRLSIEESISKHLATSDVPRGNDDFDDTTGDMSLLLMRQL